MLLCRGNTKTSKSSNSCLIGVWCCCMCYAEQKWAFPCRWCDCHVRSYAMCCWEVDPLHSGSRHTPWCQCGSGYECCVVVTGSSGLSSPLYEESGWLFYWNKDKINTLKNKNVNDFIPSSINLLHWDIILQNDIRFIHIIVKEKLFFPNHAST